MKSKYLTNLEFLCCYQWKDTCALNHNSIKHELLVTQSENLMQANCYRCVITGSTYECVLIEASSTISLQLELVSVWLLRRYCCISWMSYARFYSCFCLVIKLEWLRPWNRAIKFYSSVANQSFCSKALTPTRKKTVLKIKCVILIEWNSLVI